MGILESSKRIHPLVAVAAGAVTLFSLVGIAAITGVLPSSHGSVTDGGAGSLQGSAQTAPGLDEMAGAKPAAKTLLPKAVHHNTGGTTTAAGEDSTQRSQVATAPAPVAQKPAPHNSAVGIGVGAVVGGVLGNQVGSGDGKTLATILGAVGGGYVGNEIAKKNQ
jgi:uncharacterized protein YcfJ